MKQSAEPAQPAEVILTNRRKEHKLCRRINPDDCIGL